MLCALGVISVPRCLFTSLSVALALNPALRSSTNPTSSLLAFVRAQGSRSRLCRNWGFRSASVRHVPCHGYVSRMAVVLVFHPNCYGLIFFYWVRSLILERHVPVCKPSLRIIDFPYRFHMLLIDYRLI